MSDGKVFVRNCLGCGKLHQTADQTGKTKCDECLAPKAAALPVATPPAPVPVPFTDPVPLVLDPALVPTDDKPKREKKSPTSEV